MNGAFKSNKFLSWYCKISQLKKSNDSVSSKTTFNSISPRAVDSDKTLCNKNNWSPRRSSLLLPEIKSPETWRNPANCYVKTKKSNVKISLRGKNSQPRRNRKWMISEDLHTITETNYSETEIKRRSSINVDSPYFSGLSLSVSSRNSNEDLPKPVLKMKQLNKKSKFFLSTNDITQETIKTEENVPKLNFGVISKWGGRTKDGDCHEVQDTSWIIQNILGWKRFNLYSIIDGHGLCGKSASEFVRDQMREYFTNSENYNYSDTKNSGKSSSKSKYGISEDYIIVKESRNNNKLTTNFYSKVDKALEHQNFNINFSGTTCLWILQIKNQLICSNVGDTRGILVKTTSIHPVKFGFDELSVEHKPYIEQEKSRILKSGGVVLSNAEWCDVEENNKINSDNLNHRVYMKDKTYPGIAVSRSIGDLVAKSLGVISTPDIIERDIKFEDKYMVLASDGVWDYLSGNDIIDVINPFYFNNNPQGGADAVVEKAKKKWSENGKARDDITVIVVWLNRMKTNVPS